MSMKYWKLALGILFLMPVVLVFGICLWKIIPSIGQVARDIFGSPGTWILLGVFLFAIIIGAFYHLGMTLIDRFKFENEIDRILKANMRPEVYREFRKRKGPYGFKSTIKRWFHGTE